MRCLSIRSAENTSALNILGCRFHHPFSVFYQLYCHAFAWCCEVLVDIIILTAHQPGYNFSVTQQCQTARQPWHKPIAVLTKWSIAIRNNRQIIVMSHHHHHHMSETQMFSHENNSSNYIQVRPEKPNLLAHNTRTREQQERCNLVEAASQPVSHSRHSSVSIRTVGEM